jgi:hypothetical protein
MTWILSWGKAARSADMVASDRAAPVLVSSRSRLGPPPLRRSSQASRSAAPGHGRPGFLQAAQQRGADLGDRAQVQPGAAQCREVHLVEAVVEGERQRAVHDVVAAIAQAVLDRRDGEEHLLVGADHGLGQRGGARGVDQADRVHGQGTPATGGERHVGARVERGPDELLEPEEPYIVLGGGPPRVGIVGDQQPGFAVPQHMVQGPTAHLFVQHAEDGTQA